MNGKFEFFHTAAQLELSNNYTVEGFLPVVCLKFSERIHINFEQTDFSILLLLGEFMTTY